MSAESRFLGSSIIEVPSRKFFGLFRHSPNRRFTIAWHDGNDEGTRGGARASGLGRYVLLENEKVVCEGRLERPNDGKVANNGNFIISDFHFSSELSGTFYAYLPSGNEIIHQRFNANLYSNGLSSDGRFAVCQTAMSSDISDSVKLNVFDLAEGIKLASWRPESGPANYYEFSKDNQHIRLIYLNRPKLTYTLSGRFLDRQLWIDSALDRGDLLMVGRILRDLDDRPSDILARRLIKSIELGFESLNPKDRWGQARCLVPPFDGAGLG